ncbi:hypothetical protein [Catenulispora subtropica]|uniref:Uncharacterized protein n=1 Tax=Catenulispora subtropica TaxID=450798 RepID=A0ABP5DXK0_9ACTN
MGLLRRAIDAVRPGQGGHRDPADVLAVTHRRQRILLEHVRRGLDETSEELAYIDGEIRRTREHTARLGGTRTIAAADGYAAIPHEPHDERSRADAFLMTLTEARGAVVAEETRLLTLRKNLTDRIAECDELSQTAATGITDEVRTLIDRMAADTRRMTDEENLLEAEH